MCWKEQLSQLRNFKGKGMGDLLGGSPEQLAEQFQKMTGGRMPGGMPFRVPGPPGPGLPGMPSGGLPGMGGMGGLPGMGGGMPGGMQLPPGVTQEQLAAMFGGKKPAAGKGQMSQKERERAKQKRRAEKAARKKSRRR